MKSTAAISLSVLLVSPYPATAEQKTPNTSWTRVERIPATTKIMLTVRDAQATSRVVVGATDDHLMVLNLTHPELTPATRNALLDMARRGRADFVSIEDGATFATKETRVSRDGVFLGGVKVVDLAAVVETIARPDVRLIAKPTRSAGAVIGAVTGAVVGSVVGFVLGFFLAYDGHLIPAVAVGVGVPVAAGTLGYLAGGRPVLDVIYQAPVVP